MASSESESVTGAGREAPGREAASGEGHGDAAVEPTARRPAPEEPAREADPGVPRHIAIIMDGNGRWAEQRGLPRLAGHQIGAERVQEIVTTAKSLGVGVVTVYSFSSENWKRPADEVAGLMQLAVDYCTGSDGWLMAEHVRVRTIGRRDGLPTHTLRALDGVCERTADHEAITLCVAVNYGGRAELVDAARAVARRVAAGELAPEAIDEATLAGHLDTGGLPDPDLLIRTGGEHRLSNFLLWQLSYAELAVTPVLWPDFDGEALRRLVGEYGSRQRRFGGLTPAAEPAAR